MRGTVSLLLVTALSLALAACGGGGAGRLSKAEYERTMQAIRPVLDTGLRDFQPTDFEHVAAYFGRLGEEVEAVAKRLESIRPPLDVAALHARLVGGETRAAKAFRKLAAELDARSVGAVEEVLRRFDSAPLRDALAEVQQAREAIAAKGYRISSTAGT